MPQILVSVLKVWVLWVQGKVRMTTGLPFCSQATTFSVFPRAFSSESWEGPPWASEEGRAKRVGSGALVLNSSLVLLWSGVLICEASAQAGVGILLRETSPSFFCKQTTFLRSGGRGPLPAPSPLQPGPWAAGGPSPFLVLRE